MSCGDCCAELENRMAACEAVLRRQAAWIARARALYSDWMSGPADGESERLGAFMDHMETGP